MPTYPYALTITNPGAETGDATGWSAISPGTVAPTATTAQKNSGTYGFQASSSNAGNAWWGQVVNIPSDAEADVDAGKLALDIDVFIKCVISVVAEPIAWLVEFRDGSNNVLHARGSRMSTSVAPTAWTQVGEADIRIPPNTRNIRLSMRARETFGSASIDAFADDFTMNLVDTGENSVLLLGSPWPSTAATWTSVVGTPDREAGGSGVFFSDANIRGLNPAGGGSPLYINIYRSVTIDSDHHSAIDAGDVGSLLYYRKAGSESGDDSRAYLEWYDGSNALIGSREWAEATFTQSTSGGTPIKYTGTIPVGARSVRLGWYAQYKNGFLGFPAERINNIALFGTNLGAAAPVDVLAEGALPSMGALAPEGSADAATAAEGYLPSLGASAPTGGALESATAEGQLPSLGVKAFGFTNLFMAGFGLQALAITNTDARITQMGLLVLAKGGETPLVPDPLKLQDGGREQLLVQRLVNMYVETTPEGPVATARFQRPGLYQVAQRGEGPVRATFLWKGFRFTISGSSVWRDAVNIGEVPADGQLRWAISDEEIVVVAGNRAYYVTLTDVSRILDPDLPFVRDVKFLAGRFLYFDADTSGFYRYSKVNDAKSIDGLAFASAEANPDPIIGAEVQGEGIAMFGTNTTEWHFPTLDPDNPFQRSQGRTYDTGCTCIQTVQLADNNLHFVGNDRMVYRAAQAPMRVSTHSVEDKLRRQTKEEFEANSAFSVTFGGHTFYVLNIVGQGTWALNVGQKLWAEWKSWGKDRFRVGVADADGFLGDALSGRIMGFDGKKMTDLDGDPIERIVSVWQPLPSGTMRNFSLALHTQQGVGLLGVENAQGGDPKVEMRFSDHLGQNWTNWLEGNLGKHGVRGKEAMAQWTNLGTFPSPGRAFEFRCTAPVEFTPFMVSINEWRP